MSIQTTLQMLQIVLTFGNVCVLLYAFVKFLGKPHDTLDTRVSVLENEVAEIKKALNAGTEHFEEQDGANEVILRSTLALIDYEIQRCLTESKPAPISLQKAHDELTFYLTKR